MDEAMKAAETIASMSLPSVMLAKEVDQSRVRDHARRRQSLRAAGLSFAVRDEGSEGRHGRVRRKARAEVHERIITFGRRSRASPTPWRHRCWCRRSTARPSAPSRNFRIAAAGHQRRLVDAAFKPARPDELTLRIDHRRAGKSGRRRGLERDQAVLGAADFDIEGRDVAAAVLILRIADADQRQFGAARRLRGQGHGLRLPTP